MYQNYYDHLRDRYHSNYQMFMLFGIIGSCAIIYALLIILTPSDNYQHGNAVAACLTSLFVSLPATVVCLVMARKNKRHMEMCEEYSRVYNDNWSKYWEAYYKANPKEPGQDNHVNKL